MAAFRRMLVPTDFSDCSSGATDLAVDLAKAFDAALVIMHAYELCRRTILARHREASRPLTGHANRRELRRATSRCPTIPFRSRDSAQALVRAESTERQLRRPKMSAPKARAHQARAMRRTRPPFHDRASV
jgi:nucleotide-binding universal stress UspA family protein